MPPYTLYRYDLDDPPERIPDETEIFLWSWAENDELPEWVEPYGLTPEEIQRRDAMRAPLARVHFSYGRLILRCVLGEMLQCPPQEVKLTVSADGKPSLADTSFSLKFNVSHTPGRIALAVAQCDVGLDVEASRPRDYPSMVRRYFTKPERTQFFELPLELQPAGFLRGWTGKEAFIKGTGAGVRDLQFCTVDLDPRLPPQLLHHHDHRPWTLTGWQESEEITLSLAVATASPINIISSETW
jgi:4'-phosphopantetheinyl transferase